MSEPASPTCSDTSERVHTVEYMLALYNYYLAVEKSSSTYRAGVPRAFAPPGMPCALQRDCDDVVRVIVRAVSTQYQLSWDAHRYSDTLGHGSLLQMADEDRKLLRYPPLVPSHEITAGNNYYGLIDHPAIVTDCHGNILVWTLPRIIPKSRQDQVLVAMRKLEKHLTMTDDPAQATPGQKWRSSARFFHQGEDWQSGITCFSAGWFPQGHKGDNCRPRCTEFLRSPDGEAWMSAMQEMGGILDGILAITHPALYNAGVEVQQRLSQRLPDLSPQIALWPSVLNCAQVAVNRMTVHHRDYSGRPGWFDILLTLGTYGEHGVMAFRNLGATVPFDSGSIVLPVSRVVVHAVPDVPADRIAYSLFMSDNVHDWVRVEDPGWSNVKDRRRVDYPV